MYFNSIATVFGLVATANAHMLLAYPPPFPGNQNGPLGDGINFPCQGKMSGGTPTTMSLGSTQKLTFQGGATHGGGSCQVALTDETAPTAATKFRVITSIQGGCPLSSDGNNGNDASAALDSGLQFKIPDDIPAGKYILSWTWINRIGNREFYMNCAPVTLTGTGGDKSNLDKLPEIFVTNSPSSNTCQTPEGSDYAYPNPGAVVFNKGNPSRLVKLTCPANTPGGQPGTQTAPSTGSGSGQGDKPADTEKPAGGDKPSTSPLPGNGVKAPAPGNNPVEQPAASSAAPSATPTSTPTPKAPVSKPPVAPSAPSPSPATGNKGSGNSGSGNNEGASSGGACTPGQFKCVGGSAFQQCTAGQVWAAQIQMAAGTKCDSGAVTTSLYSLSKREVSFRA
ncbi:hypothetical protein MCOR27_004451 [Pyricularia oryzae]|uniref:Lytic polysaccharide monooxygenase n=2 Tax=Pyricularia TaxID=48558 RepID=A0ABQ8NF12_PYRGI|nr:hypothetical protein MCOR01_001036 [Pyricularia oryzae]KAI6295979.1 hypothetical protein MCOR33_007277 [Pyricularia grisea]KAH9430448.1 hypothetical protein MCOR02_010149 [Pyricularia oryzae]KAI6255150.1 hypothetical protein MCOR19_008360 [Pyricularia oryzae]KAI6271024.1 hypothetical protein MCOR26_007977 [Pyricularia oryzae]